MMQMLTAGGMSAVSDGERAADTDNPRGYLEWERIKQLPKDPGIIAEGEGKVVKVISQLLLTLPGGYEYKVIFMQRPLPEVMASQDEMLRRRGTYDATVDQTAMTRAFQSHLYQVHTWMSSQKNVSVLRLPYHEVLNAPKETAEKIAAFLQIPLDTEAMAREVDPSLYRQRQKQEK